MFIDEREAKLKWCPFVRAPVPGVGSVNRAIDRIERDQNGHIVDVKVDLSLSGCLGSGCMLWRQEMRVVMRMPGSAIPSADVSPYEPTGRGCCGMGGE